MNRALLLAKTFFGRFFESDLMPPGLPQAQLVLWSLAFLATPGLFLPVRFAARFLRADPSGEGVVQVMMVYRLLFITLSMTAVGFVALVIWDGMFPDRRDARILTGLPVPGRILIAGRLLALGALCGIFVVGVNAVPTVLFGSVASVFGAASNMVRGVAAHFFSTALAGVFTFGTLLALQGVVLNLGGRKASERMSLALQVLFVASLLQMIFFMPRMAGMLAADLNSGWLRAMPSVWFLGLYEVVGGRPAAGAPRLAAAAMLGTLLSIGGAVALFTATHGRLTKRALESQDADRRSRMALRALAALTRLFCRRPATQATFEFTIHTLVRSRSHRLLMGMYVGVALALVASAIVPLVLGRGFAGFATPGVEVLSAPLVISFFTLIGVRVALAIPVEPKANWVIRVAEPANRGAAMDGARSAILVAGVLPSALLAAISAAVLWGPRAAVLHTLVCTLMGWVLTEILLLNVAKLPFTCTYFPGKSKIGTFWPLYLSGFVTYAYSTAKFEQMLLKNLTPKPIVLFLASTVVAILLLSWRRHRRLAALAGFRFQEEDPDTLFTGFNLSEGFAAGTKESRQLR